MAASVMFRVEHLTVNGHVEDPFRASRKGQRLDDVLVVGEQIVCRAHGAGGIVSGDAVGDVYDVHWILVYVLFDTLEATWPSSNVGPIPTPEWPAPP